MSKYADELQSRLKAHREKIEQELKQLQEIDDQEAQPGRLYTMTKAEFDRLPLSEMQRLYESDPDRVREIIDSRPAYMDITDPRPQRDFTGTTAAEYKRMSLADLQELYRADPELYDRLRLKAQEA